MHPILHKLKVALGIERGEERLVLLFFGLAMALGFFHISFEISATTLFLELFDDAELSQALFISGVVGLALTFLYSKLQAWISFSGLLVGTFIFLGVSTLVMRLGFGMYDVKHLAFLLFIMMGPLYIISVIAYWGLAGRLFSMRQGKRLFGLVYAGQLFGVIILSAGTSDILSILGSVEDFLYLSSISIALAFIMLVLILVGFKTKLREEKEMQKESTEEAGRLNVLFKNKYVTIMAVFVVLSMISAFFIYFSFLSVTKIKYPNPTDLAGFLGMFIAFANVFSFIVRTFVYSKIIENYGLKVTLLLVPVLLGVFTVSAVVVGSLFGTSAEDGRFIFFFILISLSRLMYLTLRESVQLPTFEVMYQSLSKNIRFLVQAAIDGMVNEFSAIFSGILLVGLSLMAGFGLLHYSYLLLGFIAIWVYVAYRLYGEYHSSLEASLAETKRADISIIDELNSIAYLQRLFNSESGKEQLSGMALSHAVSVDKLYSNIPNLLHASSDEVRLESLKYIDRLGMLDAISDVKLIKSNKKDQLKEKAEQVYTKLSKTIDSATDVRAVHDLQRSVDPKDRMQALKIAEYKNTESTDKVISILLRDMVPSVRVTAIEIAGRLQKKEFVPGLLDNLLVPQYSDYAADALEKYAGQVDDYLEQSFYKSGATTHTRLLIIDLLTVSQTPKATEYIADKLTYPQRQIMLASIAALKHLDFVPTETQASIIHDIIMDNTAVAVWNIAAYAEMELFDVSETLKEAMLSDVSKSLSAVFDGLATLHDARSVSYVQENIESGQSEKINYALELLDLFISEELKKVLFHLFDDISFAEKAKLLSEHFPIPQFKKNELFDSLLMRDLTMISRWTKLCVLELIKNEKHIPVSSAIVSQTFDNNIAIKEIALHIVKRDNESQFENLLSRYDSNKADELRRMEAGFAKNGGKLAIMNILSENPMFANVPKSVIEQVVDTGVVVSDFDLTETGKHSQPALYVVLDGVIKIKNQLGEVTSHTNGGIVNDFLLLRTSSELEIVESNAQVFAVGGWQWKQLLRREVSVAQSITSIL